MRYDYVKKEELKKVRKEVEDVIKQVQIEVKNLCKDGKFTFRFELVGSAKHKLVTKDVDGNKGFDLDYNLIINNPNIEAEDVKKTLIEVFRKVLKETKYDKVENSTSVITIKVVDRKNSKIKYSCDFAIMCYDEKNGKTYFVKKDKGKYIWNEREYMEFSKKFDWVKANYWNEFKKQYLYLKNKQIGKEKPQKSFSLRLQACNNVFNKYFMDIEKEYKGKYKVEELKQFKEGALNLVRNEYLEMFNKKNYKELDRFELYKEALEQVYVKYICYRNLNIGYCV